MHASRINSAETNELSWDARVSVGFELLRVSKNKRSWLTIGIPFGESYTKSKGKITMADMDGNGLDDVVYRHGDDLLYYPHLKNDLNEDIYGTESKRILNVNNFSRTSGKTKNALLESFDVHYKRFYAGTKRFKTEEETNIYITDGNGDMLPDIVNNSVVYFNNGLAEDGTNTFDTSSQLTPNMLITAKPISISAADVPDTDNFPNYDYDVVRVWQAPYAMTIRIKDNIAFEPSAPESKVVYSIESSKASINSGTPFRLYLKEFNSTFLSDTPNITDYSQVPPLSLGAGVTGSLTVAKGDRIYFRLHKNATGANDALATNPVIELATYTPKLDQNTMDINRYSYNSDFLLSDNQTVTVSSGSVQITSPGFSISAPSDDITYTIIREYHTAAGVVTTTTPDPYVKLCPAGINTPVAPLSYTENIGTLPQGDVIVYQFAATSTSNVKWISSKWAPVFTYVASTGSPIEGFTKTVVPKYSVYQQVGVNTFTLGSQSNPYQSWNLTTTSSGYRVAPNKYYPPGDHALAASDNGWFHFVVKKDGVRLGKIKVVVTNGSISFENNATPILFFTGTANAAESSPVVISCEFYADGRTNKMLFQRYSDAVSLNPDHANDPYLQNGVSGNVIIAKATEWGNTPNPISLLKDYNHFWRIQCDALHNVNQHLGSMYRGWGQFLYNSSIDTLSTPSDSYGKLINNLVIDNVVDNAEFALAGTNASSCYNQLQGQVESCVENNSTSGLGIPAESTQIDDSNVDSIVENIQDNVNLSSLIPIFFSMHANIMVDVDKGDKLPRWTGYVDSQYSEVGKSKNGNIFESSMSQALIDDGIPDTESPGLPANADTGMYAINKVHTSVARTTQAGWGPLALSRSNSNYSNTNSDFIDINGDSYPDVITSVNLQSTTMTGGHKSSSVDYGTNPVNGGDSRLTTMSVAGSYPLAGRNDNEEQEEEEDTGNPAFSAGVNASYNFDGNSTDNATLIDLNGDGLPDRVAQLPGGFKYQLNMGKSFANTDANKFSLFEPMKTRPERTVGGASVSYGGNNGNMGFSVSLGYSGSGGNTDTFLQDMNGDGLTDLVKVTNSVASVQYNLGSKFSSTAFALTHDLQHNSKSNTASLSGDISFYFGFPVCCYFAPLVYIKIGAGVGGSANLTVSETAKQFSDYDGDGYADYVEKNAENLKVYYSNAGRTDMLYKIENTLGGQTVISYTAQPVTIGNPRAKWAMTRLSVSDGRSGMPNESHSIQKTFSYSSGKYDRREREFYGYETVKINDMRVDAEGNPEPYRTTELTYHNNSYFLNGLLKESKVYQSGAPDSPFSRTENFYAIKELDNTHLKYLAPTASLADSFDVGGTEGRRSAGAVLVKTRNYVYEQNGTPLLTTEISMVYDNKGRIIQYDNAGNVDDTTDNYTTKITYNNGTALVAKNILNVPASIDVLQGTVVKRRRLATADANNGNVLMIKALIDTTGALNSNTSDTEFAYDSYGNMTKVTYPKDENGQNMFYEYTYDSAYHKYVETIKDGFGYTSTAVYNDDFDKIDKTTDLSGNFVYYEYDTFGRVTSIKGPKEGAISAKTLQFTYYNKFSDLTNPPAGITDSNFRPVAITKHYDEQHPLNFIETYTFVDGLARPIQVKKDISLNTSADPDTPNYIEAVSISGWLVYDDFGRVVEQHHPTSEVKTSTSSLMFNPNTSAIKTTTEYDVIDRPILITDPGTNGGTSSMSYSVEADNNGKISIKTRSVVSQNASQSITTSTYKDVFGRVTATQNELSGQPSIWTNFTYNIVGDLLSYKDAALITTTYTYDLLGRKLTIVHPDHGKTSYTYDKASNLTKLQTAKLLADATLLAANRFIKYKYEFGRLIEVNYPDTPAGPNISNVLYEYGSATATDPNSKGKLVYQRDATGFQTFEYGNMGELILNKRSIAAPNIPSRSFNTAYRYDSWNRLMELEYPDGEKVTYGYDLGGNLNKMTGDYNGTPYDYIKRIDYDLYEQRTYLKYGNNTQTTYTYSSDLRRLETLRVKTANAQDLFLNTYSYDKVGNVTAIANNAAVTSNNMGGSYHHTYTYDKLNRLATAVGDFTGSAAQQPLGNDVSAAYSLTMQYNTTHGIANKLQSHTKNAVAVAPNSYNNAYTYLPSTHKLSTVKDMTIPAAPVTQTYTYDLNGNMKTKVAAGATRSFYWDESDRLRVVKDATSMQHYIYDASGERVLKANSDVTSVYQNGTPVATSTVTVNPYTTYPSGFIVMDALGIYSKHYYAGSQRIASRIGVKSATYFDAASAMTATAPETSEENTTAEDLETVKQLQITNLQQLMQKEQLGTATFGAFTPYTYEELQTIEAEESSLGQAGTQAVPDPGPVVSPSIYYFHPDHLGSSTFLTDFNGKAYQFFLNLPFGETMAEQLPSTVYKTPYKFNGKELDAETGFYYYGARYYDPKISIWLSVDPLAEDYPSWNPYNYTMQNPINLIDPTGMSTEDCCPDPPPSELEEVVVINTYKNPTTSLKNAINDFSNSAIVFTMNMAITQANNNASFGLFYLPDAELFGEYELSARFGRLSGDIATIVQGVAEDGLAGGAEVVTVGGATIPAAAVAAHGTLVAGSGLVGAGSETVGLANYFAKDKSASGGKMGGNQRANKQFDDAAKHLNIKDKKGFSKFLHTEKARLGKGGADNFDWNGLIKLGEKFKANGGH